MCESLCAQVREEVLDGELFGSVSEAGVLLGNDSHRTNTTWACGSAGYLGPAEVRGLDVESQRLILCTSTRSRTFSALEMIGARGDLRAVA